MNIGHFLAVNARRHPEKPALTFEDRHYTYAELNNKVNQMAHGLMALGIKKGENVALMLTNTDYFPICYYALAKIGAVIVPMNFRLVAGEVNYILEQSDSVAVITDEDFDELIEEAKKGVTAVRHVISVPNTKVDGHLSFDSVLSDNAEEPEVETSPDDDFQIMYTSGTTGRPKGALFTQKQTFMNIVTVIGTLGHNADDTFLHVAPLFHAAQLAICLNSGIFTGASHVILKDFDPVKVLELLQKHKVTFFFGVPVMYNMMLQVPNGSEFDLSAIRGCGYGAAPMAASLVKQAMDLFGTDRFYSLAGLTEGGPSGIYLSPLDHKSKIGTSGKYGLLNTEMKLVDHKGDEVKKGVHGEILLRGSTIMKEYYKKPEETAATLIDGWLHTGDLGVMDEDGYTTLVDRLKDMIISGGENIYSVEVENALFKNPKVLEAAVVGTPDAKWGEMVNALVVLKPGETADAEEIQEFCRQHLAGYKIPRNVIFKEQLPRNVSGKLLKYKLRDELLK